MIRPCPFCGAKAEIISKLPGTFTVACTSGRCGAVLSGSQGEQEVIECWNRRVGEAADIPAPEPGRPQYNDEHMRALRDELKGYVANKYPQIKHLDACSWAFYPLHPKHHLGVDFWDLLRDDESMLLCFSLLKKEAVSKNTLQNPLIDAKCYYRSMIWLKEMLDEKYGGVYSYLLTVSP